MDDAKPMFGELGSTMLYARKLNKDNSIDFNAGYDTFFILHINDEYVVAMRLVSAKLLDDCVDPFFAISLDGFVYIDFLVGYMGYEGMPSDPVLIDYPCVFSIKDKHIATFEHCRYKSHDAKKVLTLVEEEYPELIATLAATGSFGTWFAKQTKERRDSLSKQHTYQILLTSTRRDYFKTVKELCTILNTLNSQKSIYGKFDLKQYESILKKATLLNNLVKTYNRYIDELQEDTHE